MSTFEAAIGPLLKNEGSGYVPDDNSHGPSRYGITLDAFRDWHPGAKPEDIENLGPEGASAFYRVAFWQKKRIGLIDDQEIANKLLDLCVNDGPDTGVILLQRAVGVHADGVLGPQTAEAVNSKPVAQVMRAFRAEAEKHYRAVYDTLLKKHPDWADRLARQLQQWLARLAK